MRSPRNQIGLSLVELMISITLGLLILAGVTTIFVNNSQTRAEVEKNSRQIENGRYAMQLLTEDLHMAGYLGELVPPSLPISVNTPKYFNPSPASLDPIVPSTPDNLNKWLQLTALPNPCATDIASMKMAVAVHVQGYDNSAGSLGCISDVMPGTDVLVVRRASTCSSVNPADANCDPVTAGVPYLQVAGCALETDPNDPAYRLYDLSTDTASLTLRKIGCVNPASIRRYRTHIYFIANNNIAGDGIPTLKRWELGTGIVPLVEGIENLQLEYGIDTTSLPAATLPGDGIPDAYASDPATITGSAISGWWNVMSVKIGLLSRNSTPSLGYLDEKTYTLAGTTYGPYNDGYRRHAYTSVIKLANPAGRREQQQ